MYTHIPSYSSLPPSTPSHSSKSSRNTELCSLCFVVASHWLSTLHMWKSETVNCSVVSDSLWLLGLYSPLGSSVHGILQARILEWVTTPFVGDQTQVSCNVGRFFTIWAGKPLFYTWFVYIYINATLSIHCNLCFPICVPCRFSTSA